MADIAQVGFAADTSELKDAKVALDALVPSAAKVDGATQKTAGSFAKLDAAADKLMAAATGLSSAVDKMSGALNRSGAVANTTAAAQGQLSVASTKVTVSFNGISGAATNAAGATKMVASASGAAATSINATGAAANSTGADLVQLDAHMMAYTAHLRQMTVAAMAAGTGTKNFDAHMVAYRDHMDGAATRTMAVGNAMKFNAREGLNFSRQFADIGVTAAMGMNPLMIAIQQGPQLLDIFQEKAIATGTTVGAVFRAAAAQIWAAMLPLLPIIGAIALAIGTVAAAFGLATREINKGAGDVGSTLGLTEKQLERVKKAGVDTAVTMGDTFKAFFQVAGERLAEAFDGPLSWLKKAWNDTMDFIVKYGLLAIKLYIGAFVGSYYAIKAAWSLLPAAIGDIAYMTGSAVIDGIEWMINKSIDGLNKLLGFANDVAAKVGLSGLGTIGNVTINKTKNPFAGAASDAGRAIGEGMTQGVKATFGAVDRFLGDVGKRAKKNRGKLILDAAGDAEKGPKGPKSDAAKFEDIVKGAENDIAAQKARADAVKLSAEAAATLEQRTKLLNEANTKGIVLTEAMITKVDELAGAYGRAKVAADNAIALRDILKVADGDLEALKQQADLIGLVGRQLAYQTEMQKLLNAAKAKDLPVDAAIMGQFEGKANAVADQSAANDKASFMDGVTKGAAERQLALAQERDELGMNAEAVARLRIENELLAQARQKNINLTPADVAAIGQIAKEQAATAQSISDTREAMDFAKDAAKGFFNDIRSGLEEGKSLWQSFGDAAINVLNKLIDKLLDKVVNMAIDALFSSITYGQGGTFNSRGVTQFANGGTFTNSVVDKPTMFASGGMLGVMGEAGPEAIMPLKRGSDGALGVQMHGKGAGGPPIINAPISIHNDNRVSGAVSSADIIALQRQSADQTKAQIARDIPNIIRQYQNDGALV